MIIFGVCSSKHIYSVVRSAKVGQTSQNPPPTIMSAINKSRHQPQPVSFMCNLFVPLLYTQQHYNQRNSMVYMTLVGLIAN
jgi:hypothetical protein